MKIDTPMDHSRPAEIEIHLSALRKQRGLSAAWLARAAGVGRQTIYSIEAGAYIPNTAVALRLARALETGVENLFTLSDAGSAPELPSAQAALLPDSEPLETGQPVQLCRVGRRLIASPPSPVSWYLPASDAIVTAQPPKGRKANVRIYHLEGRGHGDGDGDFGNRLLLAGCDPGISVFARHVQAAGVELVLAHRNSSQALALLKQGAVHIAGTHLRDERSGESNIPEIGRIFARNRVAVVTFAVWEEGLLMARGNPKGIRGVEDLARAGVRFVNREAGSGSRRLLDSHLKRLKIPSGSVAGYQNLASGHLAAGWQVRTGAADCCLATQAAARLLGLDFVPLATERYDLVMRRQHLDLPAVQILLDTLTRSSFRRELESAGGYDTRAAGQRML